jgi:cyclopropane fatty-acyl-phospholipid synthase-like methyltransferase
MSAMAKLVMGKFYRAAAGQAERLPWHRAEPSAVLKDAAQARAGRGHALDLGCGAGVFSVWLAQQGFAVTGLDLFAEATAMARERASAAGVELELVRTDLFDYAPSRRFSLVFDSGCLHSLVGGNLSTYKELLLRWLEPGGDFVLEHWGKRHLLDWRPIGPRRRSQAAIERLFAPELALKRSETTDFETPLPFGPVVRGVGYWFQRAPA